MKTTFLSVSAVCLLIAAMVSFSAFRKPLSRTDNDEMMTYYVVIADTSQSYWTMRSTLFSFHKTSGAEIDTMGRYFNTEANKLILPENDEDEIYRGEYFPRRFPSTTLSVEYLSMYRPKSTETAFACVVGIFEKPSEAKAYVKKWKSRFPKIYRQKAEVYVGCMH